MVWWTYVFMVWMLCRFLALRSPLTEMISYHLWAHTHWLSFFVVNAAKTWTPLKTCLHVHQRISVRTRFYSVAFVCLLRKLSSTKNELSKYFCTHGSSKRFMNTTKLRNSYVIFDAPVQLLSVFWGVCRCQSFRFIKSPVPYCWYHCLTCSEGINIPFTLTVVAESRGAVHSTAGDEILAAGEALDEVVLLRCALERLYKI